MYTSLPITAPTGPPGGAPARRNRLGAFGAKRQGRSLQELHILTAYRSGERYDAVTIIDADNLVALNYLRVMNNHLLEGEKLIQCLSTLRTPMTPGSLPVFSINFWLNNRFILQARHNLGLSSLTAGSGVCIAGEVLKKTGWSKNLTESGICRYGAAARLQSTFARKPGSLMKSH